ncbi:GerAB/ArcD/ProY family transporter [Cohnella lupini]|nr:GerAB/ArcD/ProY family transporter [Cohnella lupini]
MTLTSRQMFWMMVSMQVIMTLLLTTTPTFQIAKQDAWISTLLASGVGSGIAYVCAKLSLMFPGRTLIEFSRDLFGKWLAILIAVMYLMFWISLFGIILQQFKMFIIGTILPQTPPYVIVLLMVTVVLYLTLHGVGAIARCCEIMGPLIIIGVVSPVFFAFNRIDADQLLPVFVDSGFMAIVKGALPTATFLGDCIMIMVLVSFVGKTRKVVRHAVLGVLMSGLFTVMSVFSCLLIFGLHVTKGYPYPLLIVVRSISLSGVIENMDAILISVWIMSVFTKLTLYLFVSSYGTSQLLGIKDWRKVAWPIAFLGVVMALIPLNYVESSIVFPIKVAVPFSFPILMIGLPLMMLMIALIKRKMSKKNKPITR